MEQHKPQPIIYARIGGRVTLDMSPDDYASLLIMLGYAAAAAYEKDGRKDVFYRLIDLLNRMNELNDRYMPYELPKDAIV